MRNSKNENSVPAPGKDLLCGFDHLNVVARKLFDADVSLGLVIVNCGHEFVTLDRLESKWTFT